MIKRICDKCGKELKGQPYWDIDATKYGAMNQGTNDYYKFDLCEDCIKELIAFLRRGV